jgi:hypothetical protein
VVAWENLVFLFYTSIEDGDLVDDLWLRAAAACGEMNPFALSVNLVHVLLYCFTPIPQLKPQAVVLVVMVHMALVHDGPVRL